MCRKNSQYIEFSKNLKRSYLQSILKFLFVSFCDFVMYIIDNDNENIASCYIVGDNVDIYCSNNNLK